AAVVIPLAAIGPVMDLVAPIVLEPPEFATHRTDPGKLRGSIEFRQVSFRYSSNQTAVLSDVSFAAAAGEMVAIVGPSGAGKSTIARLLLGFEEPQDGEILFDGKPLHDLDLGSVREQIGAVVQNGQLMRGTVIENILGGMKGNERTAWDGAKAAALDDDIRAMPMKMHTLVDPQLISGGQAQRILLARALVRRPPIVLLDEATSALDNIAQATVTRSLDQLGATRIVIAHRLSTIKSADRIIVMNRGQIVQSGTYDELMSQHGEFSRLANRQLL
ncbi:MAG: ATP-binding cassette domain-containing protein, partial [Actinomycetes bacterium]